MKPKQKHFVVLDGLRGVAVLLVVLSHLSNFGFNIIAIDFSGIGKCGVYLFFVLSAFLLTYQFLERGTSESFTPYAIGNYFWRRSLRVLPLFYLVVLTSAVTTFFFSEHLNGRGLPYTIPRNEILPHLTFNSGTEVLWSVPVEFKFYFALPLLALCFLSSGHSGIGKDTIVSITAIIAATYFFPPWMFNGASVDLGYYLPVFICGCYCASLAHKASLERKRYVANGAAIGAGIIVLLTTPSIYSILVEPIPPNFFHKSFILYGLLWSIILYGALHARGWLYHLLASKFLIFCGKISFSLYLLHFPILLIARKLAPGNLLVAWLAIALIILISYLSYRLFERPMSRVQLRSVLPKVRVRNNSSYEN